MVTLLPCCGSVPDDYERGLQRWRERSAHAARDADPRTASGATIDAPAEFAQDVDPAAAAVHDDAIFAALLDRAERTHPALEAASATWRAALEQVRASVAFPDPRLALAWYRDPIETRVGPMDWRVSLVQSLPRPDESDVAGRAAVARAEQAAAAYDAARLQLRRRAREAWIETAYTARALAVTRAHLALVQGWESVANTRYATGAGAETDVIRAQVELETLDDRVRSLDDRLRPLRARLDAALARPADAPELHPELPTDDPPALDEQALLDGLDAHSPRLIALAAEVATAESGREQIDAQRWPDVAVGLDYTGIGRARSAGVPDSGQDALALTLSLGLPLRRDRRAADALAAGSDVAAARARLEDARLSLRADLEQTLFSAREAARRVRLYRDALVPQGRQALEGTLTAYRVGEASFLDLLDAERALLEFDLSGARAVADLALARAAVEESTGLIPKDAAPAAEEHP